MIIKKYVGKTEAEALVAAQNELGDGVVLMNTKVIKPKGIMKIFKTTNYEITVAKEEQTAFTKIENTSAGSKKQAEKEQKNDVSIMEEKKFEERLNSLESLIEKQMNKEDKADKAEILHNSVKNHDEQHELDEKSEMDTTLEMIREILKENEVDDTYINSILDEVKKGLKQDTPIEQILSDVYQRMILRFGKAVKIGKEGDSVKIIFFVGTTGVGKTTTIAKIASQFVVEEKKKVALFTTDTYRIAAAEQLRTYANILEIPFRVIYTKEEMSEAIDAFNNFDYIFVDTAGHSQYNDTQRDTMTEYVESAKAKTMTETFLVLAANMKYKDMLTTTEVYRQISDYKLIFTKLDETDTYGNLLNVRFYTGADMSYVTYGQNVPDDIAYFDAQSIVKKLLGGK